MKISQSLVCLFMLATSFSQAQKSSQPIVTKNLVFEDKKGLVVVEAEYFYKQTLTDKRAWYINSPMHQPMVWPDHDNATYKNAGGLAYVEALPDLFHSEEDPIVQGENLGGSGTVAVLHYNVHFNKAGRYYIWARLRSNDQEDNTIGAGVDGNYPKTAQILQSPVDKKMWIWKSDNRISRNPWKIGRASIDIPTEGLHDVQFFMREDGEEFDRFVLTTDSLYQIKDEIGPKLTIKSGKLPKSFSLKNSKPLAKMPLQNPDGTIYGANVVYKDTLGIISFEAENFYVQSKTANRLWHLVTTNQTPKIGPDSDPPHILGTNENAYLELLPDGRQKDEDGINSKSSISGNGGENAVIGYKFEAKETGRYYIWVRGLAIDGDDNTLHVGLNNTWLESGKKMMFSGKNWKWSNIQRDTKAAIYIDVDKVGINELQFSMREDGCEIDRVVMTKDKDFVPSDAVVIPTKYKGNISKWYESREKQMFIDPAVIQNQPTLIWEVENIPSTQGWSYAADKLGHSGLGYLEWKTEGQGIKPGTGLLEYNFEITEAGNYQFLLRGKMIDPKNRMETLDPDGNDIWVKFSGGSDVEKQKNLGNEWNKILIIGHPEGWTWNTNADGGKEHPITPVCRFFEKGIHTVTLSGRSHGYAIDKIALIPFEKKPITDFEKTDFEKITKE